MSPPPLPKAICGLPQRACPSVTTPGGPPLWVVVHVVVTCIEGLYDIWRVRDVYTLTQVERHRALTTKISKASGD